MQKDFFLQDIYLKNVSLKAVSDNTNYYRDEIVTFPQQYVLYKRAITT